MKQLLIAMQYWSRDSAQAREVTNFMADLERQHRGDDFTLMLVHRHDCPAPSTAWVADLSRRFDVLVHRSRRFGTGWPHGPNEMWFDLASKFFELQVEGKAPKFHAMLTLEPDDVPLTRMWADAILAEWAALGQPFMLGSFCQHPAPHVNGNLLLTGDIAKLQRVVRIGGAPCHAGWDFHYARKFKDWGAVGGQRILSLWNTPTISPEAVAEHRANGVALLHGVKDNSALDAARKLCLGKLTDIPR